MRKSFLRYKKNWTRILDQSIREHENRRVTAEKKRVERVGDKDQRHKKDRRHEQKASQPRSKGRKGEDTMSCCQGIRDEKSQTHPDRRRRRPTHTQKNGNVRFFSFRTSSSSHKPQSRSILPLPRPFYSHSKNTIARILSGSEKKSRPFFFWHSGCMNS